MGSVSDQIERLTQNTKRICELSKSTAKSSLFTDAVLRNHLGDLIRDTDPAEIGLFSILNHTQIHRIQFSPLRKLPTLLDPDHYARAALKYLHQYQPIRPLPRTCDRINAIIHRVATVRSSIDHLNVALKQAVPPDQHPPLPKQRVESENKRVLELQTRIAEVKKQKESILQKKRATARINLTKPQSPAKAPLSPSSPQEDKFWNTPIGPSRTLRFTDNLLDEDVDLGNVSMSFHSPMASASKAKMFLDVDPTQEETGTIPTTVPHGPRPPSSDVINQASDLESPTLSSSTQPASSVSADIPSLKEAETPPTRQRKVKVNQEVERIVAKIWSSVGDIITPTNAGINSSVNESITLIQYIASQTPQPESPIASSVSSVSLEANSPPSFQQVMTAYLLSLLLSSIPHHTMPLNTLKANLVNKAKTCGISDAQSASRTTRILYNCVAKRLVKIDRGAGEQIVRFDA